MSLALLPPAPAPAPAQFQPTSVSLYNGLTAIQAHVRQVFYQQYVDITCFVHPERRPLFATALPGPTFGTAYASYQTLLRFDDVCTRLRLDRDRPGLPGYINMNGQHERVTLDDALRAMDLASGTFNNYKTKFGNMRGLLSLLELDTSPQAAMHKARVRRFVHGSPLEHPGDEVFFQWSTSNFWRDVQRWKPGRA